MLKKGLAAPANSYPIGITDEGITKELQDDLERFRLVDFQISHPLKLKSTP
jgi:hypothetical protein